jgi:hypothetical protein
MAFADSLEKGFGSMLKVMLENISGPIGCMEFQDAKTPLDADKTCTSLLDRLQFEPLTDGVRQDIEKYCRMSCQPEMRAVPILASFPPPLASPATTQAVAANTLPQTKVPLLEEATPALAPRYDDPADIIREINTILSGYHPDPYEDPSNFRENPYGDLEPVEGETSAPAKSNDGGKGDPYATTTHSITASSDPATTVKSSIMPTIQVIWLGAAAATVASVEQKVVYKPFYTEYQQTLCGCFNRRSTDTQLDVQMCIADAKRSD